MKSEPKSHQRIRAALNAKGYTARTIRYQRPRYTAEIDPCGGWWVAIDPLPSNGESPIVRRHISNVLREIAALPNTKLRQPNQ